ncbi:MAG: hypothetical protein JWN30_1661, partial [Bacilli bacterium]|nr:hypothetical protein [Bacilli bacterium]
MDGDRTMNPDAQVILNVRGAARTGYEVNRRWSIQCLEAREVLEY